MAPDRSRIARGRRTQALVAQWFRDHGWPYAISCGASANGKDILNTPPFAVEVKATSLGDFQAALRQSLKNAGKNEIPVVIWRGNGQGEAAIDDWVFAMRLGDLPNLINEVQQWEVT